MEEAAKQFVPARAIHEQFASRAELAAIEVRLAEFVSRKDLATYMEALSVDRQRMHEENMRRMDAVRADLLDNREAVRNEANDTRSDIRSVHDRIDKILESKLK